MERLCWDARKRSDRAFRHSAPGFCVVCDERGHGFGRPHDRLSSGVGSALALPCRVVRGVEGLGLCLLGTFDGEAWGLDILCLEERGEILSALDCDPECLAQCPTTRVAVDALLFHEAGRRLVHRYRIYRDPFPHPALRDGVFPRFLSCVCRPMAIAQLRHLRIGGVVGGASWSSACGLFSGGSPPPCTATEPTPCIVRRRSHHAGGGGVVSVLTGTGVAATDLAGGGGGNQ